MTNAVCLEVWKNALYGLLILCDFGQMSGEMPLLFRITLMFWFSFSFFFLIWLGNRWLPLCFQLLQLLITAHLSAWRILIFIIAGLILVTSSGRDGKFR